MLVRVLATNGGPHPADKWAMVTAEHLLPLDPDIVGDKLLPAQKLQVAVAEALVAHHTKVQDGERVQLSSKGDARLAEPVGAADTVDQAYQDVVAAAKGTPWEDHVQKPEVAKIMKDILHSHFKTSQDIERSWYKDRKGV